MHRCRSWKSNFLYHPDRSPIGLFQKVYESWLGSQWIFGLNLWHGTRVEILDEVHIQIRIASLLANPSSDPLSSLIDRSHLQKLLTPLAYVLFDWCKLHRPRYINSNGLNVAMLILGSTGTPSIIIFFVIDASPQQDDKATYSGGWTGETCFKVQQMRPDIRIQSCIFHDGKHIYSWSYLFFGFQQKFVLLQQKVGDQCNDCGMQMA